MVDVLRLSMLAASETGTEHSSVAVSSDGSLVLAGYVNVARLWRLPFDESDLEHKTSAK